MDIVFHVPDDKVAELNIMMKKTDLKDHKALFNEALTMFQWGIAQREKGCLVASVDEKKKKYTELSMNALNAVPLRLDDPTTKVQTTQLLDRIIESSRIDKPPQNER